MKNIFNHFVYIAPYNDVSIQVKEYLDEHFEDVEFCGFIDKFKAEVKIKAKDSIVIVVSPNYFRNIHNDLMIKYDELNVKFVYAMVIGKHRVYFTNNLYVYSLYSILLKLTVFKRFIFYTIKNFVNESKNYLYKNNYFLPEIILKYQGKKEIQKAEHFLLKEAVSDEWLQNNKNLHKGKRCFILATGPSLNKVDLSKLKDEYTIGVNGIYKIAQEIDLDYYIYVSSTYWKEHVEGMRGFKCKRKFLPKGLQIELESKTPTSWINVLMPKYYSKLGYPLKVPSSFSQNPQQLFVAGGTVVYLGLQLAYYLGFSEIVILGLDHNYIENDYNEKKHGGYVYDASQGDKAHFDKEYMPKGTEYHVDLDAMENGYRIAKKVFESDNRKILNASQGTKLTIFDTVDYDELF